MGQEDRIQFMLNSISERLCSFLAQPRKGEEKNSISFHLAQKREPARERKKDVGRKIHPLMMEWRRLTVAYSYEYERASERGKYNRRRIR
jgi:hypothetical protein